MGLGGAPAGSAKLSKTRRKLGGVPASPAEHSSIWEKLGGDPAGPAILSFMRPSGAPASSVDRTRTSPNGALASLAATGDAPPASSQGYASMHGRSIKT